MKRFRCRKAHGFAGTSKNLRNRLKKCGSIGRLQTGKQTDGGMGMDKISSQEAARLAIEALEDKKAEDIRIIDISDVSVIADYFIIAGGNNRNQIQALCDNVEEKMGRAGIPVRQIEGYDTANWILLDFGDVIVHIFDRENRLLYDLERIWRDGKQIDRL